MTVRRIAAIGHPVLRTPAQEVPRDEFDTDWFRELVDDMVDTMRHAGGAGIAANQVHVPLRVFAVEIADNPRYPYKPPFPLAVVVNPTLEMVDDERYLNNEGCLSVPGLRGDLYRPMHVVVTGWDATGANVRHELTGLTAGTFQHEMDHLEGRLYVDRVEDSRTFSTWEEFDRHGRTAYLDRIQDAIRRTTP